MSKASLRRRLEKLERTRRGWKGWTVVLRRPEWSDEDLEREIARHEAAGVFVCSAWPLPPGLTEWPPELIEQFG